MPTTAQAFFPSAINWDGVDPVGGDVRRLDDSMPSRDNTSIVDLGASGTKTITVDPFTGGRTTTGTDPKFGWALNIATPEPAMGSTADAKRLILASVWNFTSTLFAAPVAALADTTAAYLVYRVSADGLTRTLLFFAQAVVPAVSAAGTAAPIASASQPAYVLEAGETLQLVMLITGTGQVGGLTIAVGAGLQTGGILPGLQFSVPAPGIRTQYPRSLGDVGPDPLDALTRTVLFPRALGDAGPDPVDALSRAYTGARSLADAGPDPADVLTRVATFPRALADLGPDPLDALMRIVTFNRALDDLGPNPVDALVRAWAGARSPADLGPEPLDALARVATYARGLEDDISPGGGAGPGPGPGTTKKPVYVWDD